MPLLEDELYHHDLWALNGPDGFEELVEGSLEVAVKKAHTRGGTVTVDLYGEREDGAAAPMVANPSGKASRRGLPLVAMETAGLPTVKLEQLLKTYPLDRAGVPLGPGLEAAYEKIKRFFPRHRRIHGTLHDITLWQSAEGAIGRQRRDRGGGLLASNFKIGKPPPVALTGGRQAEPIATGLSLAPNWVASQAEPSLEGASVCLKSTAQCRAMCLVYTGQNEADPYNVGLKIAKTRALLTEPAAFVRVLLAAIHVFVCDARCSSHEPFIRLNVYSDIPWELFAPGLFEFFSDVQFYDYTKVPGRSTPKNYDLTFSLSGSRSSYDDMKAEVKRGRRVAVVFDVRRHDPLPKQFLGMRVIDGDVHDIRPLDPGRIVVGLRWKPPLRAGRSFRDEPGFHQFVVPVTQADGKLVVAHTPRYTRTPDPEEDE